MRMQARAMFALLLAACLCFDSAQGNPYLELNAQNGGVLTVQLFNWRWEDVGRECTDFLGPHGFGAVQVSPPQEHPTDSVYASGTTPWWLHYQPVSYVLDSRMGTRAEFASMLASCNSVGVNVLVDVVINHMTGSGLAGTGSAGSSYDTTSDASLSFPVAGWTASDFHSCTGGSYGCDANAYTPSNCNIQDFNDHHQNQFCRLVGLVDLATEQEGVRAGLRAYLNDLLSLGVKGFRVDAAGHMEPADLWAILSGVDDTVDGKRPFVVHESTHSAAATYGGSGRVTDFNCMRHINNHIKTDLTGLLAGMHGACVAPSHSLVFVTNHDQERSTNNGACVTPAGFHCDEPGAQWFNAMAQAIAITYPHGLPRIMSGYNFATFNEGPPHHAASNNILPANAAGACLTGNGWDCRHRSPHVFPLAALRAEAAGEPLLHSGPVAGGNAMQVAFSLGSTAFVCVNGANSAQNAGDEDLVTSVRTGLPAGTYCNVVYAQLHSNKQSCVVRPGATPGAGRPIQFVVNDWGYANVDIRANDNSRVVASHLSQRIHDGRVPVRLVVKNAFASFGDGMRAVGSVSPLGTWTCSNGGASLSTGSDWHSDYSYPNWSGIVFLDPAISNVYWKPNHLGQNLCSQVSWPSGNDGYIQVPLNASPGQIPVFTLWWQ